MNEQIENIKAKLRKSSRYKIVLSWCILLKATIHKKYNINGFLGFLHFSLYLIKIPEGENIEDGDKIIV